MSSVYPSHSQCFKRQKLKETGGSVETEMGKNITGHEYSSFAGESGTVEEILFML
jgi:hypothetical protein